MLRATSLCIGNQRLAHLRLGASLFGSWATLPPLEHTFLYNTILRRSRYTIDWRYSTAIETRTKFPRCL
jgi:hypothetical protein